MKFSSAISHGLVFVGIGLTLIGTLGCEVEYGAPKTAPGEPETERQLFPPSSAVEDLKKDVKPPVVVKPNTTSPRVDTTPAPNRE
jgi:hypothetical protein